MNNFDSEYHWEIEKAGYPLNKILEDIERARFNIKRTYRIFENSYHRFFILKNILKKINRDIKQDKI